jgi:hypothetical protein
MGIFMGGGNSTWFKFGRVIIVRKSAIEIKVRGVGRSGMGASAD